MVCEDLEWLACGWNIEGRPTNWLYIPHVQIQNSVLNNLFSIVFGTFSVYAYNVGNYFLVYMYAGVYFA